MADLLYKVLEVADIEESLDLEEEFARDVFVGFSKEQKAISSRYLYDTRGSEIYEEIMALPDYYPLRSEYEILKNHCQDIAALLGGSEFHLVELGAGNGYKTNLLLEQFIESRLGFQYVPIDISEGAISKLADNCREKFPNLDVNGIVAEYSHAIKWLASAGSEKKNLVLFLGSNIGNFLYEEAAEFLYGLWSNLNNGDYLLIGFDLRKDIQKMIRAYNDSNGVTARFNLNLLTRMNREIGANFDVNRYIHYGPYDVYTGAMTSYIISMDHQDVYIERLKRSFHFKRWESIRVEQSYKYTEEDILNLAKRTGHDVVRQFYDSERNFVDSIWRVVK